MEHMFRTHLAKLETFVHEEGLRFFLPMSNVACCSSMLRILDGLLDSKGIGLATHSRLGRTSCATMWAFAAVWGYGGALAVDRVVNGRKVFHSWWEAVIGEFGGDSMPAVGTVFDFFLDSEIGALKR